MATLKDLTVLGNSRFIGKTYGILPEISGNAWKVLAVNSGETGVEWVTQSGGSGIGKETVYAQCYTAAATTQKDVQINDYTQKDGDIVVVYFSNAVPANASLSINSGTALPIFCSAAAITSGVIKAGDTATFMIANAAVAGCLLLSVDRSIKAVTIYSGSTAPSSSTGNDGDIYIQTVS